MPLLTPEVDSHGKADATLHFGSRPLTDSGTPHSDKQRAKERPAPPPLADPLPLALPLPRSTTPSSATSQNLLLGVTSDNSDFQNSFRTHAARHGIRSTLVSNKERRAPVVPLVNRGFCSPIGLHRFVRVSNHRFPDMPCMKKVYKDTLLSSQERRAAVVARSDRRLPTMGQPRVLFPHRIKGEFLYPFLRRVAQDCGNSSNFRPIRTDWIVNRLGWVPTPENLLSAAALFGETAYSL